MDIELVEKLDRSRFVPVNYPGVLAYKYAKGCPKGKRQCPEVPCYTKEFFCSEWGQNFKCMCPQQRPNPSPYRRVRNELASLDYFTRLPANPNRKYPYPQYPASFGNKTMAQRYGLEDIDDCPKSGPAWARLCPENQKVFNLMHVMNCKRILSAEFAFLLREREHSSENLLTIARNNLKPEDMFDLPFCVKVGSWPGESCESRKSALPRTGVSRCIQPSSIHDIQSVHRENFLDFFATKTEKELKYYRSPLAINNRRPPLTLPSENERDIVASGPICVNALPLVMRPKGGQKFPRNLGPNFQVIVQGPICI